MRPNRPPGVASNAEPAGCHRGGAGVVRTLSVAAVAAAALALGVLPATAATAHAAAKHASKTTVSAPKTAYTHTDVKLSATVKGSGKTPTGTVTFWLGTKKLCRGTLSKGATFCEYKFADPATKRITGKYSGDATHKVSSGTATIAVTNKPTTGGGGGGGGGGPIATTTNITNPAADVYAHADAGTTVTLTATVTPNTGDSVPTGTVAFTLIKFTGTPPPNLECTTTLVDGNAACNVTPAVGTWGFVLYEATYTPTAGSEWTASNSTEYPGDPEHKLVTWDITATALTFSPATATVGDPVTLTADVTDEPMDALASAYGGPDLVNFTIGGVAIPGCTGVAVTDPSDGPDNIATCTYTPTTAGPVTITAAYQGDDYALPSSDTETLTVNS